MNYTPEGVIYIELEEVSCYHSFNCNGYCQLDYGWLYGYFWL